MGKSQNTLFLATGIDGKRGMEVEPPIQAYSLEEPCSLLLASSFILERGFDRVFY